MKKDKFRLILISVIIFALLTTAILYGSVLLRKGKTNPGSFVILFFPLVVVVIMGIFVLRRYRDVKNGMPLDDERSKKVINRSAAMSFYISIYWLLAISWYSDLAVEKTDWPALRDIGQGINVGILGMAVIFFICWAYYERKGRLV
jgi:uncharacterized membrane protein